MMPRLAYEVQATRQIIHVKSLGRLEVLDSQPRIDVLFFRRHISRSLLTAFPFVVLMVHPY